MSDQTARAKKLFKKAQIARTSSVKVWFYSVKKEEEHTFNQITFLICYHIKKIKFIIKFSLIFGKYNHNNLKLKLTLYRVTRILHR